MSKQNPTVEDSEEYKKLKANCIQWQKEAMAARDLKVEDSEEYKSLQHSYILLEEERERLEEMVRIANKRANNFDELWLQSEIHIIVLRNLLKQFHYGPVTEEYKERVKEYLDQEGLLSGRI